MTPDQIIICKALGGVRYLPASFDKRLGLALASIAEYDHEHEITEKQNEWMYRLLYKYRNQLPKTYGQYKDNPFCSRLK